MKAYQQLENLFKELAHLNHIEQIMTWDEATMMPIGGGNARAAAMATFKGIQHQKLTQEQYLDLINEAQQSDSLSHWQSANLFWMEKQIRKALALPTELIQEQTASAIQTEQAWRQYRAENNWHDFLPYLQKTFSLVKEAAQIRAEQFGLSAYDICIDDYCPGMTQATIDPLFDILKNELPTLMQKIITKQKDKTLTPQGPFPIEKQKALAEKFMKAIGFDFEHGRLDTSHHPFCGGVPEDVRITTRYKEDIVSSALFGICHETGHALYEQGLPKEWLTQPVGQALGMAVHESQSLIIEMEACHSHEFTQFFTQQLKSTFNDDPAFETDNLYRMHTQVKPSLIRVDADEVTYPLHVIIRYEIEKDLLSGATHISDLPEIWDAKMSEYLNISTKDNYKDGVMQDVHWPSGTFGYFPAYTLGRLIAAQLFHFATHAEPSILTDLSQGNFTQLKQWLNQHIHSKGSSLPQQQLLESATNEPLNSNYFLQRIKERYL